MRRSVSHKWLTWCSAAHSELMMAARTRHCGRLKREASSPIASTHSPRLPVDESCRVLQISAGPEQQRLNDQPLRLITDGATVPYFSTMDRACLYVEECGCCTWYADRSETRWLARGLAVIFVCRLLNLYPGLSDGANK